MVTVLTRMVQAESLLGSLWNEEGAGMKTDSGIRVLDGKQRHTKPIMNSCVFSESKHVSV